MIRFRSSSIVVALLLLAGCAQKSALLVELSARTAAIPGEGVCGKVETLTIVDEREGVSERDLRVPLLSRPGQNDEVRPPLSDSVRQVIEGEVRRRIRGDAEPVAVTVKITEGVQRFRSRTLVEQESVRWGVEVSLKSVHGHVAAGGEMEALAQSRDASLGFVERLSSEALRGSVAQALEGAAKRLLPGARACRATRAA